MFVLATRVRSDLGGWAEEREIAFAAQEGNLEQLVGELSGDDREDESYKETGEEKGRSVCWKRLLRDSASNGQQ
jgi:hypothetical protein